MTLGPDGGARRLRVLAMDDQPSMRSLLQLTLSEQGHDVQVTESWAELSKEIFSVTPDVVILDLNMPALPGDRLAAIIRRYAPSSVIILLSGESAERLRSVGEDVDYAYRKRELPQLLELLRQLAAGLRPARGRVGG